MMEAASTSETSVNYQATRRNIPEDSHIQNTAYLGEISHGMWQATCRQVSPSSVPVKLTLRDKYYE
jgi:hypothetical protein